MTDDDLQLLYVPDIARLTGKTEDAIYAMRRRGRIPLRKIGGGAWGMLRRDYVRWVRGDFDRSRDEPVQITRMSKYVDVLAPRRHRRGA